MVGAEVLWVTGFTVDTDPSSQVSSLCPQLVMAELTGNGSLVTQARK